MFESVMVYHHHFGSSQAERGRIGRMMPAAIWLWTGLLRETQAGANLHKTLPACLRMRMTCPSILWLCVRAATVFLWSCDTVTNTTCSTYFYNVLGAAQGHCSLKQFVVLSGEIEMNRTSISFYHYQHFITC